MTYLAGIDIGNATTETAIAHFTEDKCSFCGSGIAKTTGLKGTVENIPGVISSLNNALKSANLPITSLHGIKINNAAPVIGDVAMETISETIIIESSMIGHNPETPGGEGLCTGLTVRLEEICQGDPAKDYIVIISSRWDFEEAAQAINSGLEKGCGIKGAIVQKDDAVLIHNRISKNIPIVDEVKYITRIPMSVECAVEVAKPGQSICTLSNPFGLATIFQLSATETKKITPTAKILSGKRSAVVLRTPQGAVAERKIPAGSIEFIGLNNKDDVSVDEGALRIMDTQNKINQIQDIRGEPGTNIGIMFSRIRQVLASLTDQSHSEIRLKDIMAADTYIHQQVEGGIAEEFTTENAVGIAALVKTQNLQLQKVAKELERETGLKVSIDGVEAEMALKGALTTPGVARPLVVLDLGAGSTDAAFIDCSGAVNSTHVAGAGDMVTMLIDTELGLNDRNLAEDIKKYPLAKVESLSQIRHEDGTVQFLDEALDSRFLGHNIVMKPKTIIMVPSDASLETIRAIRRGAKKKVFKVNAIRVLEKIFPKKSIADLECVVIVGGSALDFEIPNMLTDVFLKYKVVAGQANVRGTEGPRNAVATGLLIAHMEKNQIQPKEI
jgi:diol dehydratase reactivase alpha subunit